MAEAFVKELISTDKYYTIEYDSAQTVRGLTKVPVLSKYNFSSGLEYRLINQAQEEGVIKVEETRNVPELIVYNQAAYPVLIPCGSLFISQEYGMQDRTAVTDVMIGAGEHVKVPVACVERSRWGSRNAREIQRIFGNIGIRNLRSDSDFHVRYFSSPLVTESLLRSVSGKVGASMYRRGEPMRGYVFRADQSQVWDRVEKEIEEADVETPTRAFTEVVVKKEREEKLEFEVYDSEIGDIFIGNGRVLGMELYEAPRFWQSVCEQTIKRYKMGVEKEQKFERGLIDKFLSDLSKCNTKAAKSVGLGYDVRLVDGNVEGACLVVGDKNYAPAHFTAIPSYGGGEDRHVCWTLGNRYGRFLRDLAEGRQGRSEAGRRETRTEDYATLPRRISRRMYLWHDLDLRDLDLFRDILSVDNEMGPMEKGREEMYRVRDINEEIRNRSRRVYEDL